MSFEVFFAHATGVLRPYPYQTRLAMEPWPDALHVPTGMGKTAAVVLAWLYKRGFRHVGPRLEPVPLTPRRLVICLPMRVLVEQTFSEIQAWLESLNLRGNVGDGKVSVHVLMGGSDDVRRSQWTGQPEEDTIIIGTQDMLLSRALMRGYGMSRYQWPVHFALLHNDCMWVYDEVQLMGAGLPTSTQLEAFRRDTELAPTHASRSLWVSATLHKNWLGTVDFKPHLATLTISSLQAEDRAQESVQQRLNASKRLHQAEASLSGGTKNDIQNYIAALAGEIIGQHQVGEQTLVIINNVDRAQQLYIELGKRLADVPRLLLHARFRAEERQSIERQLRDPPGMRGRIIIATQAIEAGVDITSRTLFTELAPWASMVQRFGRCNRDGKHDHADIFWIDIATDADKLARPYDDATLAASRETFSGLKDVGPVHLPQVDASRPLTQVLRRRDFLELFNTDADLSGFDIDVSPYIRDGGTPPVQVFWREVGNNPGDDDAKPQRQELCPASIIQIKAHLASKFKGESRHAWRWDTLAGRWTAIKEAQLQPGMTVLLDATEGGYEVELGFVPASKTRVHPVIEIADAKRQDSYNADWRTQIGRWVSLSEHLGDVATDAAALGKVLRLDPTLADAVTEAGRWHDLGKAHEAFQHALEGSGNDP
ncbi:MAG: DEAD/DEAH box helicase, partial [Xanthomonadales bacterium]|nr:DEAD/DEAH box helicase [Xanthomonadales bacterium]